MEQLNRMEQMLSSLITMQATNNAKLEELTDRVDQLSGRVDQLTDKVDGMSEELKETKETLHLFRSDVSLRDRDAAAQIGAPHEADRAGFGRHDTESQFDERATNIIAAAPAAFFMSGDFSYTCTPA